MFFRERLTRVPNSLAKKLPSLDTEEANFIQDPAHRGTVDFCPSIAWAGVKGGMYIGLSKSLKVLTPSCSYRLQSYHKNASGGVGWANNGGGMSLHLPLIYIILDEHFLLLSFQILILLFLTCFSIL